jgi:hypothetical protein
MYFRIPNQGCDIPGVQYRIGKDLGRGKAAGIIVRMQRRDRVD